MFHFSLLERMIWMRLDKFLSQTGFGSRKEAKALLKKKVVAVNGELAKEGKQSIDVEKDRISVQGKIITYQEYYYYMLNKPQGVISATEDKSQRTVLDLFKKEDYRMDLFPVGRLDKDTVGLLLITNDGALAHELLSPKKHVDKTYIAKIEGKVTNEDVQIFALGMQLANQEQCLPAQLTILNSEHLPETQTLISLVIQEGKFHQVKRMFEAVNKKVVALKRIKMGPLQLDETLKKGQYRSLTNHEIALLKEHQTRKNE